MGTARIDLVSFINLTPELLGIHLPGAVQAFQARLDKNQGMSDDHFIVCAYYPPLDQETCELIAAYLLRSPVHSPTGYISKDNRFHQTNSLEWPTPDGFISFITEDEKGRAAVISGLGQNSASPFEVAATVAIVKASCGWDESNPMMITVNGVELAIRAHFDGSGWMASWSDQ